MLSWRAQGTFYLYFFIYVVCNLWCEWTCNTTFVASELMKDAKQQRTRLDKSGSPTHSPPPPSALMFMITNYTCRGLQPNTDTGELPTVLFQHLYLYSVT